VGAVYGITQTNVLSKFNFQFFCVGGLKSCGGPDDVYIINGSWFGWLDGKLPGNVGNNNDKVREKKAGREMANLYTVSSGETQRRVVRSVAAMINELANRVLRADTDIQVVRTKAGRDAQLMAWESGVGFFVEPLSSAAALERVKDANKKFFERTGYYPDVITAKCHVCTAFVSTSHICVNGGLEYCGDCGRATCAEHRTEGKAALCTVCDEERKADDLARAAKVAQAGEVTGNSPAPAPAPALATPDVWVASGFVQLAHGQTVHVDGIRRPGFFEVCNVWGYCAERGKDAVETERAVKRAQKLGHELYYALRHSTIVLGPEYGTVRAMLNDRDNKALRLRLGDLVEMRGQVLRLVAQANDNVGLEVVDMGGVEVPAPDVVVGALVTAPTPAAAPVAATLDPAQPEHAAQVTAGEVVYIDCPTPGLFRVDNVWDYLNRAIGGFPYQGYARAAFDLHVNQIAETQRDNGEPRYWVTAVHDVPPGEVKRLRLGDYLVQRGQLLRLVAQAGEKVGLLVVDWAVPALAVKATTPTPAPALPPPPPDCDVRDRVYWVPGSVDISLVSKIEITYNPAGDWTYAIWVDRVWPGSDAVETRNMVTGNAADPWRAMGFVTSYLNARREEYGVGGVEGVLGATVNPNAVVVKGAL
jgi:hypothetical protein